MVWDPLRTINGRYDLCHQIGEGGMGRVWLALDRKTAKHVALKILGKGSGSLSSNSILSDLRREYAMLRDLSKRARHLFVEAYNFAWGRRENGERFIFYTMEYVPGAHIGLYTWAEPDEYIYLCRQMALVTVHLEEANIVHGDVKPANILVVRSIAPRKVGEDMDWKASKPAIKVLDFGLAQEWRRMEEMAREPGTRLEGRVGRSFRWMAPEILEAEDAGKRPIITGRCDVYSMGMVFYELAAGWPAFPQKKEAEVLKAKRDPSYSPPPVKHLSPQLNDLLRWMMSPEPEARPRPDEILAALRDISPTVTVDTGRSDLGSTVRRIPYVEPERTYEVARELRESITTPGAKLFVLDGPAGIGKRRLVNELRGALGRETHDAIGAAGDLPRLHVVEVSGAQRPLEQLGPNLSQLFDGPASDEFLARGAEPGPGPLSAKLLARQALRYLDSFVVERSEGVVVAVEEIQELDRDVRSLFLDIAERVSRLPIVFLFVGELESGTDDLRTDLEKVRRIKISPLDERGTSLFLSRQLGGKRPAQELLDHIHQASRGLPGRIEEELQSLRAGDLLQRREDGSVGMKRPATRSGYVGLAKALDRQAKVVLSIFSLMPRTPIDVKDAAMVLGLGADGVAAETKKLLGLGLLAQTEDAAFQVEDIHLARSLWEQVVPRKERARLHGVAAALCSRWAEERPERADELRHREARHRLDAGDLAEGVPLALRAAAERQSLRYFGQALDIYGKVIDALTRPTVRRGPRENESLFHALMRVAPLHKKQERFEAAMTVAGQAVELARRELGAGSEALALLEQARCCGTADKGMRDRSLDRAWDLACQLAPGAEDVVREVLVERARRLAQSRETREAALEAFERVIAMCESARKPVPPRVVIDLARCRSELFDERDQKERGLREMTEALALARQGRDVEAQAHAHKALMRFYLCFDRYPDAKKHAAEGALLFDQLEDVEGKHYCQSNLITLEVWSGPLERVESHARALVAELPESHQRVATASLDMAEAFYHLGDYVQALTESRRWKGHDSLPLRNRARRLAGRCWAELGLHGRALRRFALAKSDVSRQAAEFPGGADWENLLNDLEVARIQLRLLQNARRFEGVSEKSAEAMPIPDLVSVIAQGIDRAANHGQDVYGATLQAMLLEAAAIRGTVPDPRAADAAIERLRDTGAEIAFTEMHFHLAQAFAKSDPARALGFAREGLHTPGLARDVGLRWRLYGIAGDLYADAGQHASARESYSKSLALIRGCVNRMLRHKTKAVAFMRDPHKDQIIDRAAASRDTRLEKAMGARA
ncbi:MAG: protein kinase [Acidobacteriota bacterium]